MLRDASGHLVCGDAEHEHDVCFEFLVVDVKGLVGARQFAATWRRNACSILYSISQCFLSEHRDSSLVNGGNDFFLGPVDVPGDDPLAVSVWMFAVEVMAPGSAWRRTRHQTWKIVRAGVQNAGAERKCGRRGDEGTHAAGEGGRERGRGGMTEEGPSANAHKRGRSPASRSPMVEQEGPVRRGRSNSEDKEKEHTKSPVAHHSCPPSPTPPPHHHFPLISLSPSLQCVRCSDFKDFTDFHGFSDS
jgi:hypothetical protein